MSDFVMNLQDVARAFVDRLTPNEKLILAARFSPLMEKSLFDVVKRSRPSQPKVKKGRGQRKNRRDRAGRVKHLAHVFAQKLIREKVGR